MLKIKIIIGTTRPTRFGHQPAEWLEGLARDYPTAEFEVLDLRDFHLPLLDEPAPPMSHKYSNEHTKKWSKAIDEADGFIIVTAEYNHSIPGSLKNAIDYLYDEWNYKPVTYVSYGSAAGGSRAVEHLRGVAGEQKMFDLRSTILMPSYYSRLDEDGNYQFSDQEEHQAHALIDELLFWSEKMRQNRLDKVNAKSNRKSAKVAV